MKNTIKWLSACCIWGVILAGCNSTPTKPVADISSEDAVGKGAEAYNNYIETNAIASLDTAIIYFRKALATNPEHLAAQKYHYLATYLLLANSDNSRLDSLKQIHADLHPLIQLEVPPPSRLTYMRAAKNSNSTEILAPILQQMIQEQPSNANSWYELSKYHESKKNYWLSLYSAKHAHELNPDDIENMYRFGDSLNDVIQQYDCIYDEKPFIKRSVTLIAKAAAKKPNQLYLDTAGLMYLRLGLIPLAYSQAKKAWHLDKNFWTAYHYGTSALLMNRYDESHAAAQYLAENNHESWAYMLQAQTFFAENKPDNVLHNFTLLENYWATNKNEQQERFNLFQINWITGLISGKPEKPKIVRKFSYSAWKELILDRFDETLDIDVSLTTLAAGTCQTSQAHFYEAYKAWQSQDNRTAKKHLQKTLETKTILYSEFIWATLLLQSNYLK